MPILGPTRLLANTGIYKYRFRHVIDKTFLSKSRLASAVVDNLSLTRSTITIMAPIKKRTTARAKSARAARPSTATVPNPTHTDDSSAFPSSKRDKLKIKHSSFVSKIEKSSAKTQKRRRPNKKLVANLESLADALPDGVADGHVELGQARIVQPKAKLESMKKSKGAKKRKEKLEKLEKERFNANLVQLAGGTRGAIAVQDRWAALKNHVQSNMEVRPEFAQK
ncbi:ribosome biogenesis SLX9-domain-containing [Pyrenophora seminiperda CCB06]|uniref:Ribosome biogenesis protein SLX9 n=1 Tax=Pyrenophora seminiperda CCB06 TaxID=1302712 RepID=A0A3M7LYN0_9PLEO|nr:ribosome biogenesis SLX9-domain-containing [Pyrenophora seminiperda CCB06]